MFGNHRNSNRATILFALFCGLIWQGAFVHASITPKDSDRDGLTDAAEQNTYHTDPITSDSDGDAIADGQEVSETTDPLDPRDHTLQNLMDELRANPLQSGESLAWYIGRASGILTFVLITIVVVNGLLISTRLVFKVLPPALNLEMHHFLSWMALLATAGHFGSFFFDKYVRLSISDVFIPFTISRNFPSALGFDLGWTIGLGTLALYAFLTLVITSQLKGKYLSVSVWRKVHFSSFAAYLLMLGHALFTGTDSATWWLASVYALSAVLVFGLTVLRLVIVIREHHSRATVSTPPLDPGQP